MHITLPPVVFAETSTVYSSRIMTYSLRSAKKYEHMSKWHPFSISSSPHQEVVTLHIRIVGYWTNRLYQIAEAGSDINILLEGPYGSLAVDLFSERYKLIMLFSGGIGK